jgi:hypothetical protein
MISKDEYEASVGDDDCGKMPTHRPELVLTRAKQVAVCPMPADASLLNIQYSRWPQTCRNLELKCAHVDEM